MTNNITKEVVKAALEDQTITGDGHSILAPNYYKPHFDVTDLEIEHNSDYSSGKSTIYSNGQPVGSLKGVYNLTFLDWLCDEIGLTWRDYGSYNGRGTQARSMVSYIAKWANEDYTPMTREEYEAQRKNNE